MTRGASVMTDDAPVWYVEPMVLALAVMAEMTAEDSATGTTISNSTDTEDEASARPSARLGVATSTTRMMRTAPKGTPAASAIACCTRVVFSVLAWMLDPVMVVLDCTFTLGAADRDGLRPGDEVTLGGALAALLPDADGVAATEVLAVGVPDAAGVPEVDGVAGGATVRVLVDVTLAATGLVDGDSDGTAVDVGL